MTIGCRRATKAVLSVVLMMALAITVGPTPVAGTTVTLTITMRDALAFEPNSFSAAPGDTVNLTLINAGALTHTFTLFAQADANVPVNDFDALQDYYNANTKIVDLILAGGGQDSASFTAPMTEGTYTFVCMTPGHAAAGMHGVLIVAAEPIFVWGTAVLIETEAGVALGAQVAVDPQGNATAVWHQFNGTHTPFDLWANRFVPGVGWGTAVLIETEAGVAGGAQVAVDPQGNVTAVWGQWNGTRANIMANRFVPGVGWGTAVLIETEAGHTGGAQVAVDPQGNVTAVWDQSDGTRSNIWANRFAEDIGPPVLVLTSPADGAMLTSTLVTVTGTASDDLGVDKVELGTDGMTWVLATGTTSWSGTVTLAEGPNTIYARATDKAGKTDTVTIAVTVDSAKPTVAIIAPADGSTLISTSVIVFGTASDDVALDKVEGSTDGTNWVLATGTLSWFIILTLANGENTIFARATDTSGNTATVSITVTVDTVKPIAEAGEDQTANAGATVSFDASGSSDNVAIVSYEWDFGDGTTGTGETTTHIYTDPGTYTVTLTVRDAAGNADTDVLIVTVVSLNLVPPEVVTFGVLGGIALVAAGVALLLWRRRAGGKEKA